MTDHDDLRRGLDNIAATIDVGDLELAEVRTTARRRRRRVQLTAGLGAVALLAGATVAVVAVVPDDEPDSLVIGDVQEPDESSPSTSISDEEPATTELSTAATAQTVEVIERPGVPGQSPASAVRPSTASGPRRGGMASSSGRRCSRRSRSPPNCQKK